MMLIGEQRKIDHDTKFKKNLEKLAKDEGFSSFEEMVTFCKIAKEQELKDKLPIGVRAAYIYYIASDKHEEILRLQITSSHVLPIPHKDKIDYNKLALHFGLAQSDDWRLATSAEIADYEEIF